MTMKLCFQNNNQVSDEKSQLHLEVKRQSAKLESLSQILIVKDERIEKLTSERNKLSIQMKDLELKQTEARFEEAEDQFITNLRSENELLRRILDKSKLTLDSSSNSEVLALQKKEVDYVKEIDHLKQKLYSYKQMLKEYEILLSIFKVKSEESETNPTLDRSLTFDEPQIEELMRRVKSSIEVCITKLKRTINPSSPVISEAADSLMKRRIEDLSEEKSGLLKLFSEQENSYKAAIELKQKEASKLKENLRRTLELKSQLEMKLADCEGKLTKAGQIIESLKEKEKQTQAGFDQMLAEKDCEIGEYLAQIHNLKVCRENLENMIKSEHDAINKEKDGIVAEIAKFDKQIRVLQDELKVTDERLKLKDEEIYQIKENYESQLEEIAIFDDKEESVRDDFVRIIPLASPHIRATSSEAKMEAKREEQKKKISTKYKELQDKVHNLCNKLFSTREVLLERDSEIARLQNEIKNNEISLNNVLVDFENLKQGYKLVEDELALTHHENHEMK